MPASAQRPPSEQVRLDKDSANATSRSEEMPGEAQLGEVLARALIQHIKAMRAAGYEEELTMNGEVWHVEVTRKSPAS